MRRQVVLAAGSPAATHAGLFAALAAAGERAGWLDLDAAAATAGELEAAADAGAFRAVAAAPGRVATLKPIRGRPVLADLLREHFRGCLLVLVRGAAAGLIRLDLDGAGWRLTTPAGRRLRRSTAELVAELGRPSLWRRLGGESGGGGPPPAAAD